MKRFAARLPIYVVVSQCDRILGFTEFFGRLDADAQAQAFGGARHLTVKLGVVL